MTPSDDQREATADNKELWDAAGDILELLNIEDTNAPSLTEAIADLLRPRIAALSSRPALPAGDEPMTCVHCGRELGKSIHDGLYTHANNLQRCQADVPYGHMGHPSMPCPSGTVNACLGSREEVCDHLASRPSSPQAGARYEGGNDGPETDAYVQTVLAPQAGDEEALTPEQQDARNRVDAALAGLLNEAADERGKLIAEAKKASVAVYLATDGPVADDLSRIIRGLISFLESDGQEEK